MYEKWNDRSPKPSAFESEIHPSHKSAICTLGISPLRGACITTSDTTTSVMPPKPVLDMDMDEFRTMQNLMIKVQKQAKAIKKIQEVTLPNLRQQLAETTGIFKGKERKALEKQIQQTETELAEKLDKIPDILKDDGYPDVQAFMKTYRKAEAIVIQYNQDLAEWEQAVKNGQKPAEKQHRPPERQSVRNRLRQLQEDGKQNSQPKQRKKSQDRER